MPFAIILIGILLISSGARNRAGELGALIAGDFSGPNNFFYWVGAFGAVGAVGYYEPLRPVSRLFLFLLILSMALSNNGFFAQLLSAIENFQAPPPANIADTGTATADPGAGITGNPVTDNTSPAALGDLITKYGNVANIPDNAPLPSNLSVPKGVDPSNFKTMGDFRAWFKTLPQVSPGGITGDIGSGLGSLFSSPPVGPNFQDEVTKLGEKLGIPSWVNTPLF